MPKKNQPLLNFGAQLSTFVYQIYHYLTFNTEQRPFPFSDWPSETALIDHNNQLDSGEEEVENVLDAASKNDMTSAELK